jgi:hypothetical protein
MTSSILKTWQWTVTPTRALRAGDVFTSDAGRGLLAYVGPVRQYGHGYAPRTPETRAVDMTGRVVTLLPGVNVHVFHVDDLPSCDTCEHGCYCDRTKGDDGCEHAFCWAADVEATCDGALRERVGLYSAIAKRRAL